jgi:hypothetical protein
MVVGHKNRLDNQICLLVVTYHCLFLLRNIILQALLPLQAIILVLYYKVTPFLVLTILLPSQIHHLNSSVVIMNLILIHFIVLNVTIHSLEVIMKVLSFQLWWALANFSHGHPNNMEWDSSPFSIFNTMAKILLSQLTKLIFRFLIKPISYTFPWSTIHTTNEVN